jgi:hypothetical protein
MAKKRGMTERKWLVAVEPMDMTDYYGDRFTERKARLLMLAACLRQPKYLKRKPVRSMLDLLAKHYSDPKKPDKSFDSAEARTRYKALERFADATDDGPVHGVAYGVIAAAEPTSITEELGDSLSYLVYSCMFDIAAGLGDGADAEQAAQADLVREVLGNPFRKITVKPAWRTSTAVALARQAYQSEDFSLLPILADALQDAGCDNEYILDHCRGPGPHARGCWVIDLVLGKA